jgi:hypothetical protein
VANNLTYKVLPEFKLIVEYFEGQINLQDLINFQMNQLNDAACKLDFNDLTDVRNAQFVVLKNDLKKYVEFVRNNESKHHNRKIAIIADKPNQTAITMLYSAYTERLPLNNKVFSTVEAAVEWMGLGVNDLPAINDAIETIKNKDYLSFF